MNDKYTRAQEVLRREIPNLSNDAAARVLDALLDAASERAERENEDARYQARADAARREPRA